MKQSVRGHLARDMPNATRNLPSEKALLETFVMKYGPVDQANWGPRRRLRAGYFMPADVYETVVAGLVSPECRWLDVGGGHSIFPDNPALARSLVARSAHVMAVDPSDNVMHNEFVHARVKSTVEAFQADDAFDLVTMRMVAEHVEDPDAFTAALAGLVRPGGAAVVFTVSGWAPVSVASHIVPFRFHHAIKQRLWGGDEEDTFPTFYRMNSHARLRELFGRAGFDEALFARLDDLSAFGEFKLLGRVELQTWRALHALRIPYPESCLLAVYRRR